MDERIQRSGLGFERALFEGDAGALAEADRELDGVGCYHQLIRRDNEAAVPVLWRSLELATQVDDPATMSEALRHLGIAEHAAGRLDAARLQPGGVDAAAARDGPLARALAEASGARGLMLVIDEARAQL